MTIVVDLFLRAHTPRMYTATRSFLLGIKEKCGLCARREGDAVMKIEIGILRSMTKKMLWHAAVEHMLLIISNNHVYLR